MDHEDSPSAIGGAGAGDARDQARARAAAWDHFYAHCHAIIQDCPGLKRLSGADRDDCVQDVMLELVRKFGEDRPDAGAEHLNGWIRLVTRSKAVDILRRRSRKPEVLFDDGSGGALPDAQPGGAEDQAARGEHVSLIWEALLSLDHQVPVTSYLVFYMHAIEGWSIPEIAELFAISPEQVRARSHRVKKKFSSILQARGRRDGGD